MSSGRSSAGTLLDPTQCRGLSLGEKRELVHEIAQWAIDAPTILSSFSRKELLEIICAEMGRDRKFSGRSKTHMIQRLLKLVSKKTKPRKTPANGGSTCQNVACRASMQSDDTFCKRCSCCICLFHDEDKDPTLWLTCSSDSCGLSFHLACGISRTCGEAMGGNFVCLSCGKKIGLMRTWKKQLEIAKDTRRVDVLCLRVLLAYKMLAGTGTHQELHKIVERALQKLKEELGPLDLACAKMARGVVTRLSCGVDVQTLCASAIEASEAMAQTAGKTSIEANVSPLSPSTPDAKKDTESEYECSVRAVKVLEQRGLIEEEFRVRFLTWFSLKASVRERRVVNAYVDTLIDDPESLAGQIVHSFSDLISSDQKLFQGGVNGGFPSRK